jgi:hypothetical protein
MSKNTLKEVREELAKPENRGVIASVDTETGRVRTVMAPKPYWKSTNEAGDTGSLTASEVTALEKERQDLIAALPGLKKGDRSKATTRLNIVEGLLRRARSNAESDRINFEREQERVRERTGDPRLGSNPTSGNAQPAVNWAAMSMADQTDLIQATLAEMRRAGAAK